MSRTDQLIDRFVERINSSAHEWLSWWDIPEEFRIGAPNKYNYYDWQIQRSETIDWITAYEEKLPAPLPPAFRSLVTRYMYPAFEMGPLWLFANIGTDFHNDMSSAVFKDKVLSEALLQNGYIQFARPSGGSYDVICFDTKQKSGIGEYPIIWIDHEGILCDDEIRIVKEVADSFHQFVEVYLDAGAKP